MKKIKYEDWVRKEHCDFYEGLDNPFYSICAQVDVTDFHTYVSKHEISFYYAMIYMVMSTLNEIEEFKTRLRGNDVIIHEALIPSFTDIDQGGKLHKIVKSPIWGDIKTYADATKKIVKEQNYYFPSEEEESQDNFTYISCLPWVSFTSFSNAANFVKDDFIPRVNWGKYQEVNHRLMMPMSIQVNHRAIDGIQIGEFFNGLDQIIGEICHKK